MLWVCQFSLLISWKNVVCTSLVVMLRYSSKGATYVFFWSISILVSEAHGTLGSIVLEVCRVCQLGRWSQRQLLRTIVGCGLFFGCFSVLLLRCGWLPSASQSVQLKLLQHGSDMGQTQCDWLYSGLSPERTHVTVPLTCCTAIFVLGSHFTLNTV